MDTFAFGIVMLEVLTGLTIYEPVEGYSDLHCMYEEELDSADKLVPHLDKRASWHLHTTQVATLHSVADRCLEPRRLRRPEIVHLIPELEEVRRGLGNEQLRCVPDKRECVVCWGSGSDVAGWMMLRPCGHVCVCPECCVGLVECPLCRGLISESFPAFL